MTKEKITLDEKKTILYKTFWSVSDIKAYFEVCRKKAYLIKKETILKYPNSICLFNQNLVLADAVLNEWANTNRKQELTNLLLEENYGKN